MPKDNMQKRYDFLSTFYSSMDTFPLLSNKEYFWRKEIIKKILIYNPKNILEIGTGPGMMISIGTKISNNVKFIGIDVSMKMLRIAKKRTTADYIQASGYRLPFRDRSIDSIIFAFTLTTVPETGLLVKESDRVLKKGGIIGIIDGKKPDNKFMRTFFYLLDGVAILAGNTHFERDSMHLFEKYQYKQIFYKSFYWGLTFVTLIKKDS
ncbi:MAG: class I SAM-dependent methyltransferase [Thermoplasmata archaeon]